MDDTDLHNLGIGLKIFPENGSQTLQIHLINVLNSRWLQAGIVLGSTFFNDSNYLV